MTTTATVHCDHCGAEAARETVHTGVKGWGSLYFDTPGRPDDPDTLVDLDLDFCPDCLTDIYDAVRLAVLPPLPSLLDEAGVQRFIKEGE